MRDDVLTCGHSSGSLQAYVELLRAHGVTRYVDVRRWPRSRRHPHFNDDSLREALQAAGIRWVHEPRLGGHREPSGSSENAAWGRPFLRGYADHLASEEARAALGELVLAAWDERSRGGRLVVACAERRPEDCHRQVLADALVAHGLRVLHVIDAAPPHEHVPPPFARIEAGRVTYPREEPRQGSLF